MTAPSTSTSDPLEARILDGRYHIEGKLGAGGMGSVYRARSLAGGAPVAIKLLQSRFGHIYAYRKRFIREARIASRIVHPNVTRVLDFGQSSQGRAFFVMEYLPGEDLRKRLKREGPMSWANTRTILRQVLAGLRAAHDTGVLHRDIKPSNVFLAKGREGKPDQVKLLDFGLAKAVDPNSSLAEGLTLVDEIMGTAQYLAPERIVGEPADTRSDLYSVGVMAFRMLSGELPRWGSGPTMRQLMRRTTEAPPSLAARVPGLCPDLDALIQRAMARSPQERFCSLQRFEDAMMSIPTTRRRAAARRWRAAAPADVPSPSMAMTRSVGVIPRAHAPTLPFAVG